MQFWARIEAVAARDSEGQPISRATVSDVSERVRTEAIRRQAEEALQARTRELALLNDAGRAFITSLEMDQVLATVLDQVDRIIGITACAIWLLDPKSGDLVCREAVSPRADIVRGWRLAPGQGLAGWVGGSTWGKPERPGHPG